MGELSGRRAVLVGLATSLGLLTKGFALGLPVTVVLAYLSAMRRGARRPAMKASSLALAASAPGVTWWLVKPTAVGYAGLTASTETKSYGAPIDIVSAYLPRAVLDLSGSLWANLGWLNTPLPNALHLVVTGTALILMGVGSWRWRREVWVLVVLHASWVIPLIMIIAWSLRFYLSHGFVDGMQGRYLFGGVVTFSTMVVAAVERWPGLMRLIPLLSLVAAVAGMVFGLRAFWAPADPRTVLGWWPGGNVLAAVALLLVALSVALMVREVRSTPEPL